MMGAPAPAASFKRLTPDEIKAEYRKLADTLNLLERSGEELTLIQNESVWEVRGLTGRAYRDARFKSTWSSE